MGTKYTTNPTSGYNSSPPSDDGTVTETNRVKYATVKTKITDPVKTRGDNIDADLLLHFDRGPTAISTTTTIAASHFNEFLELTGTITLTMTDAATLGAGWFADLINADTNVKTIARATAANTINGVTANVTIPSLGALRVLVNTAGNGFITESLDRTPLTTRGDIVYRDANGPARLAVGTANTYLKSNGTDLSYVDPAASQAEQETGTSNTVFVTPGRTQYHPGVAKFWCKGDFAGNIAVSHNVTSISDDNTGEFTITIATDFSSADYVVAPGVEGGDNTSSSIHVITASQAAGSVSFTVMSGGTAPADAVNWYVVSFGDQ